MKTELISTVFLSEKRKNILLMLANGPITIDEIKESLTGTTSAIMAQVKMLLEQGLIEQNGEEYKLTYVGRLITKKIQPLIETVDLLEGNREYWGSRDLSAIPSHLMDRIWNLGKVVVHESDLNHLFEPPEELRNSLKQSKNVSTLYSYFCPTCPMNYAELAKKEINFDLVLTRSVYGRLKEEYEDQYDAIMESESSNLFVCEDDAINLGALSITDDLTLISFFNKEGHFDYKKAISYEESALEWSNDLFEYYKQIAEKIE